jgi:HEAT repeat protein
MLGFMPGLALSIFVVSLVFVSGAMVQMTVLLTRRKQIEHRLLTRQTTDVEMSRELLAVVNGTAALDGASTFVAASSDDQFRILSHFIHLVRGEDRDALLRIADQSKMLEIAIKGLTEGRSARRVDAMRILEVFPTSASIEALHACLSSDRFIVVRLEAAATLARVGNLPEPAAVIHMLDLTHQPITRLHNALFRSAAARDALKLVQLAQDERYISVRALLVEALGWSNNFEVLGPLRRHADDPNPEVRCAALKAARRLEHPGATSWAVRLLLDSTDIVRIQAIQACAKLGAKDAIPILTALIENPSWWVRTRAKQALEILRPGQGIRVNVTGMYQ